MNNNSLIITAVKQRAEWSLGVLLLWASSGAENNLTQKLSAKFWLEDRKMPKYIQLPATKLVYDMINKKRCIPSLTCCVLWQNWNLQGRHAWKSRGLSVEEWLFCIISFRAKLLRSNFLWTSVRVSVAMLILTFWLGAAVYCYTDLLVAPFLYLD